MGPLPCPQIQVLDRLRSCQRGVGMRNSSLECPRRRGVSLEPRRGPFIIKSTPKLAVVRARRASQRWLEAFEREGGPFPKAPADPAHTTQAEKGTPQGGVISPLLHSGNREYCLEAETASPTIRVRSKLHRQ